MTILKNNEASPGIRSLWKLIAVICHSRALSGRMGLPRAWVDGKSFVCGLSEVVLCKFLQGYYGVKH